MKTKQLHSSVLRSPVSGELRGVWALREEVEADNSRLDGVTSVTDLSWAQGVTSVTDLSWAQEKARGCVRFQGQQRGEISPSTLEWHRCRE